MSNGIYLDFEGYWYHINLLTPAGSVWIVEWGDGASKRLISTGEWQWDSHGYDFSEGNFHTIHIFTENGEDIVGFGASTDVGQTLKNVNISNCPSLKYFKNAYAENIDTSHNPLLKELHCEYGTFDALDLSNNPMQEKLTCYSCKNLNELNLSRNLALRELELNYSGIKRLGLHNRSSLQNVQLFDVELDERSEKYLRQVVEQNGGNIIKDYKDYYFL